MRIECQPHVLIRVDQVEHLTLRPEFDGQCFIHRCEYYHNDGATGVLEAAILRQKTAEACLDSSSIDECESREGVKIVVMREGRVT